MIGKRKAQRWGPEHLAQALQNSATKIVGDTSRGDKLISRPIPPENEPVLVGGLGSKKKKYSDKAIRELLNYVHLAGLQKPELEYRFDPDRRWRFDIAWPQKGIAAEYEGGIFHGGSHTRGKRYQSDCEKYNEAALAGWTVLRFTWDMVFSGLALAQIQRAHERIKR